MYILMYISQGTSRHFLNRSGPYIKTVEVPASLVADGEGFAFELSEIVDRHLGSVGQGIIGA